MSAASTPWLHRWSRPLLGAIALLGIVLTSYLTWVKLTGQTLLCPSGGEGPGCETVLTSAYGTVFGLPLSVYGLAAYVTVGILALLPVVVARVKPDWDKPAQALTWQMLLVLGLAMATMSAYLVGILVTELHVFCPYCWTSAFFSFAILILTLGGKTWEDFGGLLSTGAITIVIVLVATTGIFAQGTPVRAENGRIAIPSIKTAPQPGVGWEIPTRSRPAEIALAKHLTAQGFKMYGAYWCPHCTEQKFLFGKQAFEEINYIECGRGAKNAQIETCKAAGIQSFPSWEINGELVTGIQSLEDLAFLSGYEGDLDFTYYMPGL